MPGLRIAVCDDHPVFRAGVIGVLATQSDLSVVVEAGTVAELRARLDETPVDVVLLDLELPERSGLDALPELAQRARVVVFSAFDDPERIRRAMQAGAVGYVRKDTSPPELFRGIRDAAAGEIVLDVELASRVAKSLRKTPDQASFERRLHALTARQRQVLALLREGRSAREIGDRLQVSEGTAKNHVTRILQLLQVEDRAKLVHLLAQYRIED
jgi:DNA-binding NarL/FixJ family response regulator